MGNNLSTKNHRLDDDTQKKLFYGYVRKFQQLLPQNNSYYNIPISVYSIFFRYYNFIGYDEWIPPDYDCKYLEIKPIKW